MSIFSFNKWFFNCSKAVFVLTLMLGCTSKICFGTSMFLTGCNFSPLCVPNCEPPSMKKVESELISFAIKESLFLSKERLKRLFKPFRTAVPLLDPPPSPAFIGMAFLIEIDTFGNSGLSFLTILNAFVPKLSDSGILPQSVLHEKFSASSILIESYKLIS